MNIKEVIETTKDFYKNISKEFSDTRQYAWKGWRSAFENIELPENCKVVDLGCGNARFYDFLIERYPDIKNIYYTGLDTDKGLLNIAQDKHVNNIYVTFKEHDIIYDLSKVTNKYDLVVGFGITHHIPEKQNRVDWFKNLPNLIEDNGYLVLSFWDFLDKKSLVKATELEKNDYWLSWGNKEEIKRYCHYYDEKELNEVDQLLKNSGMKVLKEIKDKEDQNTYKIYQKVGK